MYYMTFARKCWRNDKQNSTHDLPGVTHTLETQEPICRASCHKINNIRTNPKMKKDPVCWTTKVDYVDTIKSWLEGCLQGWIHVCIHNTKWLEQEYKYSWNWLENEVMLLSSWSALFPSNFFINIQITLLLKRWSSRKFTIHRAWGTNNEGKSNQRLPKVLDVT